jgi:Predicted transcriptional regulator
MKFEEFVNRVGKMPVVDVENLLSGVSDPLPIKVQISRWLKAGKLIQLKRGFYLLADAYRKSDICEPYIASILKIPSYISLEKALEYHDLIPEAVTVYTSVTTKRPGRFVSKIGVFDYRHIKQTLFWGYESMVVNKQTSFIASPEKALLDLCYMNGMKISQDYLEGLRLQNTEKINTEKLFKFAKKFEKPGMLKVAKEIEKFMSSNTENEKVL